MKIEIEFETVCMHMNFYIIFSVFLADTIFICNHELITFQLNIGGLGQHDSYCHCE